MSTTTATVLIPISTVTIPTVSLETVYWTVTVPTPTPLFTSAYTTTDSGSLVTKTKTVALPSGTSTGTQYGSLPPVINPSVSFGSSTVASTPSATSSSHPSSFIGQESAYERKKTIIGGLSGSIAGLVLAGFLLTFLLRRYKRRRQEELDSEKGRLGSQTWNEAIAARPWTNGTGTGTGSAGTVRSNFHAPPVGSSVATVDEDHRIIRMSLSHWVRPFAHGRGEGWRDSVAPGALRVVNPDDITNTSPASLPPQTASRPHTPAFLRHPRTAIAAALTSGRSRTASRSTLPIETGPIIAEEAPSLPEISIAPTPSQELLVPAPLRTANSSNRNSASFRSYPSAPSLAVVRQRPPEDPFASNDANDLSRPYQRLRRYSSLISFHEPANQAPRTTTTTTTSPAETTTRRISNHLSDLLASVKKGTQTLAGESASAIRTIRQVSPDSTFSSVWTGDDGYHGGMPDTGRSDPFDLSVSDVESGGSNKHRSWRKSHAGWNQGNKRPSWAFVEYTAYEGT